MNKVILIGNLAKDPEGSVVNGDVSLCKFSLAVQRNFKDKDGNSVADFINIVAWRGLADNCLKFLSKGKKAAVSGEIQNRSYEDKDGNKRFTYDIIADSVEFLSQKQDDGRLTPPPVKTQKSAQVEQVEIDDDDLPF